MRPNQDKRYTYAAGRIRALESRLMNNAALERLIEAESADEEAFILKERNLSPDINENLLRAYKVLGELSLDKRLADTFRLKYDFHNLKIVLMARASAAPEADLSGLGLFSLEDIRKMAGKERVSNVPFDHIALIERLEQKDSYFWGLEIDKELVDHTMAVFTKYEFLKSYLKKYIDLKNMVFYFRLKDRPDILKEALLGGGYLNKNIFSGNFETNGTRLYDAVAGPGLESLRKGGGLDLFEKLSDDYLLGILKPAKFMPFGVEPLFGYCCASESQARSIDFILSAKRNRAMKETIRRHLRGSYVQ